MQEVTGSSPVSPTTSFEQERRAGRAPRSGDHQRAGTRLEARRSSSRGGTTRERPANRSGRRPLARPERVTEPVAKAGGTAGEHLSSCRWMRGVVILRRPAMPDEQVAEAVEIGLEAPERGSADELLDAGAHSDLDAMRHSSAHVMAEAVLDLFPDTKLGIGPAIADGFYYDFEVAKPLTPDDLVAIETR